MNTPRRDRTRTVEESIAIAALNRVGFPPASWDKRFARSLMGVTGITEKEAPQLWRLFIRYRRQINCPRKAELLAMAEKLSAPDFRKLKAAREAQARIDEAKRRIDEAKRRIAKAGNEVSNG